MSELACVPRFFVILLGPPFSVVTYMGVHVIPGGAVNCLCTVARDCAFSFCRGGSSFAGVFAGGSVQ